MPSLLYYLWEIPIVTAFVLCGVKVGFFTALASVVVPFAFSKENPMPNLFYCLAATIGSSPPLGFSFSEPATTITMIYRAVYDFSLALYTIPLGYIIAEAIKRHIKV